MDNERLKSKEYFWEYLKSVLSTRSFHALWRSEDIVDYDTFIEKDYFYWHELRNVGKKSLDEIIKLQVTLGKKVTYTEEEFFLYLKDELSMRAVNAIKRTELVHDLSSLLSLSDADLQKIENIGNKTVNEIKKFQERVSFIYKTVLNLSEKQEVLEETLKEKVYNRWMEGWKRRNPEEMTNLFKAIAGWIKASGWDEHEYGDTPDIIIRNNAFIDDVFSARDVYSVLKDCLCDAAEDNWPVTDEELLYRVSKGLPQEFIERIPIMSAIRDSIAEKRIEKVDYGFLRLIPDIYTAIMLEPKYDERKKGILIECLQGKTFAEVGDRKGVTRQRIKQIEQKFIKRKWYVKEERLKSLFCRYCFSKEELESAFGVTTIGYRYLQLKYKRGNCPSGQSLDDEEIPQLYRARLKKAIYADYLEIDGVYVPKDRKALIDFSIRHYCLDDISIDEFCTKYHRLLYLLEQESSEELSFPNQRFAEGKINLSHNTLWKYGKRFRYYDVDAVDIEQLLKDFHFDELSEQDVEVGAQLFLDRYPDVAAEYDLRDAYELHNLLKKRLTNEQLSEMNLSLSRMPNLCFGTPDREQQVLDILEQFETLSCDDLVKEYYKAYGIPEGTFLANYAKYVKRYLRDGFYSMEVHKMTGDEPSRLRDALTRPYYIMEEVRHIFKQVCPGAKGLLNRYNLDMLGFDANDNTIYRKEYHSFINAVMTSNQERGIISLNRWEGQIKSYILPRFQATFDVVEFTPGQYIMLSKLETAGITRDSLFAVSQEVKEQMDETYFTIKSFRLAGGKTSIDSLGFEDYFLASLLRFGGVFQSLRHGNTWLFYQGKSTISFAGFIEDFMESEISISTEDILHVLKERYGIYYKDSHVIIEMVKSEDNDLYYNRIMSRIYRDYDVYFQEV